jgi:hypothetical protein
MKIKNDYILVCIIWIFLTILHSVNCVVNFVDRNLVIGFMFLVIAVAFSFISGILLEKALEIHKHNKICDFLEDVHEFLIDQIEPFEEFENGNK